MPANQTPRCVCQTALSFFACRSQACRRTRHRGVSVDPRYRFSRASLAPTGEPGTAVCLSDRVIVLRGQASLLRANQALRCVCQTALSFFAGKPRSYGRTRHWSVSVRPRYRSSRASLAPTGEPGAAVCLLIRVIVFSRASLAPTGEAGAAVCLSDRVIAP